MLIRQPFCHQYRRSRVRPAARPGAAVRHAVALPVIAAGAIATAADVRAALRAGAVDAMVGTVVLRTQESGSGRGSGRCCVPGCLRRTQPGGLGATRGPDEQAGCCVVPLRQSARGCPLHDQR
ncbi:nitronate monooxygenase [Streptomyces cellulosae]|uniref:Nitronate monooxygenase n=1 Tax=Streptomyces cellulosae TaxID=1968 RepID=A0ABW7YIZ7_STRCE